MHTLLRLPVLALRELGGLVAALFRSSRIGAATPTTAPVGVGGGGTMYAPLVSPVNNEVVVVACDRGGLYSAGTAGSTGRCSTTVMNRPGCSGGS